MTTPVKAVLLAGLGFIAAVCAPTDPPTAAATCTFTNPIGPGQDPWLALHGSGLPDATRMRAGDWVLAYRARGVTYDEAIMALQGAGHFVEWGEDLSNEQQP